MKSIKEIVQEEILKINKSDFILNEIEVELLGLLNESDNLNSPNNPVLNDNFWKWFGNSKIVDAEGNPIICYHGTGSDFSKFDTKKAHDKEGREYGVGYGKNKFYFTISPYTANSWAERAPERGDWIGKKISGKKYGSGIAPNVMPVYLSIKNPITFNEYSTRLLSKLENESNNYMNNHIPQNIRDKFIEELDNELKNEGIDGIFEEHNPQVVAFYPYQIKSATGNNGEFSPSNPDITKESVDEIEKISEEKYHFSYPQHRGELTFDKIVKRLKGTSSNSAKSDLFNTISPKGYTELKKFNSPEEIMENIYWHGSGGGVSGGLQAGFNIVKKGSEGGGGYGEQYHTISLSKNKNKASNFTGMSRYGMVYPVLLRKEATVEEMPHIQDANEIEDILVDMWLRKIDAVKIGDWSNDFSEEELVVLNPYAILKFEGEGYQVYEKKRFINPDITTYQTIYNTIQNNPKPDKNNPNLKVQYNNNQINENINETTFKVYHGTNEKFDRFDLNRTTQGIIWFTDNIDSIKNQTHGGQGSKYIMTRYITINKPAGWDEYKKYGLGQLRNMGYDGVILPQGDKTDYFVFSNKSIRKVEAKNVNESNINESGLYDFREIPIDITEENYNEALTLRQKYSLFKDIGVATFLTTTILWRAIDENEYNIIMKSGKLSGGNWAIPAEKYFGASFSGSRDDALLFGKKWKEVDRLKGQLYLIGINAQDKEFLNLAMVERMKKQGLEYKVGDIVINSELGNHGIGFSVRDVTLNDVKYIYKINEESNGLDDITYDVLDETYSLQDDSSSSPLPDFGDRIRSINESEADTTYKEIIGKKLVNVFGDIEGINKSGIENKIIKYAKTFTNEGFTFEGYNRAESYLEKMGYLIGTMLEYKNYPIPFMRKGKFGFDKNRVAIIQVNYEREIPFMLASWDNLGYVGKQNIDGILVSKDFDNDDVYAIFFEFPMNEDKNLNEDDYRGQHQAPNKSDSPLYDVTLNGDYPEDIYDYKTPVRYYGDGFAYDNISLAIIRALHNKPNKQVKIYRAVPKVITNQEKIVDYEKQMKYILKYGKLPVGVDNWKNSSEYYNFLSAEIEKLKQIPQDENDKTTINSGDWVTINLAYAKEHGESQLGRGKYKILTKTVPARDVYTDGNSMHEWGYVPSGSGSLDEDLNK
jgi:hypothetical protein